MLLDHLAKLEFWIGNNSFVLGIFIELFTVLSTAEIWWGY